MRKPRAIPAEVQAAFGRFWAAYPVRQDNPKKAALAAFDGLVSRGVEAEALIRAADAYRAYVRASGMDPKFIPHARTWLSQERFEDYLTVPDAPVSAQAAAPGPNPEHPLSALHAEVGAAVWLSYFAPASIEIGENQAVVTAATRYACDKLERDFGQRIRAVLGVPVTWRTK